MSSFSETLFKEVPIVGILRGYEINDTLKIVTSLYKAGFTNVEITMNTPDVELLISTISQEFKAMNVGAGTVCNEQQLNKAVKNGAQFIVTPILDEEVVKKCKEIDIPVFPGAYTPSEIYRAWDAGARMVKVFPSSILGPRYIREVLAPLNTIELMPTGGVTFSNIPEYQKAGARAFGMGSALFDPILVEQKKWNELTKKMRENRESLSF